MKQKILLDTDIGTDVDDAIALAYLLAKPDCELLGITTVTGESVNRAMLASVLCKIAGKKIPIYPGIEKPIVINQLQKAAQQARALKNWDHDKNFPQNESIEFLRATIRSNPGEIILLTIGPLTNIGLLFSIDPEIPSLLKGIVSMAGKFDLTAPAYSNIEWNAVGDYHAADIVYRADCNNHRSIGIDITSKVTMNSEEFKKICNHDLLKPVLDFSDIWFEEWDVITFHDPLSAAVIFNDSICTYEKGNVKIEIEDPDKRGMTIWQPDKNSGKHEVAVGVKKHNFFKEYLSVFY
ncbi:MAG: nucleoside hydrolase [Melioribacteraceae bacterium]|nr:nucleoside hydrolase [Melioribacteraceae bacterium]MCF8353538.1 nucleoside hydrolase [Melioribacteraceae bacterium]MCF8392528.1 nucleoside hydrolase [Melioribacteraceae bacterium]MCF8418457.1 nucleoside hydrolase [Melioribacteraceae bacterium]